MALHIIFELAKIIKTKLKEFVQHLHHEVEDEEKAEKYRDEALTSINLISLLLNF